MVLNLAPVAVYPACCGLIHLVPVTPPAGAASASTAAAAAPAVRSAAARRRTLLMNMIFLLSCSLTRPSQVTAGRRGPKVTGSLAERPDRPPGRPPRQ